MNLIEELDRNRVQINFKIQEGKITKISKINILGIKSQNPKKILKLLKLKATNFGLGTQKMIVTQKLFWNLILKK